MKENWSESRVKAVLHQYRAIAEVLHDPGTVSGSDSQRETDDTLSYLLQLVIEKADIEQAILYLPWPRLVPAALYWIGGYYQGSIALLEGCRQSVISDALQQAQEEVVGWLVHGRYPSPPRYTGRRRAGYAHPVYAPLEEAGWRRVDWETVCHAAGKTRGTGILGEGTGKQMQRRVESVWLDPRTAAEVLPQRLLQLEYDYEEVR